MSCVVQFTTDGEYRLVVDGDDSQDFVPCEEYFTAVIGGKLYWTMQTGADEEWSVFWCDASLVGAKIFEDSKEVTGVVYEDVELDEDDGPDGEIEVDQEEEEAEK